MKNNRKGFTLIEMMIVLAIITILSSLAYPNYLNHITRMRRTDGQTALLELANQMETYYRKTQTYATATIGTGRETDIRDQAITPDGWYQLSILHQTNTHYTLQAKARMAQAEHDPMCVTLAIDDLGNKKPAAKNHQQRLTRCW